MELEQARKRVAELREVIERNNRLYYMDNAPELEDFEYDALTRELKALEAQYPALVMLWKPRSTAFRSAWNTKTAAWYAGPPAATVLSVKM